MITRRTFLGLGTLALAGLHAGAAAPRPKARRCILLWLQGGPSHLDLFDLKPDAPSEIRGEFRPAKGVDGAYVCEHLPGIARRMKSLTLLRSVTSPEGNHDRAAQYLLTGHRPSPALAYPGYGAIQSKLLGVGEAFPSHVALPSAPKDLPVSHLGPAFEAFVPPQAFPDLGRDLLQRRRAALRDLEAGRPASGSESLLQARETFLNQAFTLLADDGARAAFSLDRESPKTRQAYGPHLLGRSLLTARRLLEAGSRFVTVVDDGWDTHESIFKRLRDGFPGKLPGLDQAYSALVDDLGDRGLLQDTLVVVMGEFGRTPKINSSGGRDHWPRVNSVLLAGGGLKPGVLGSSDAHGELPDERPISVEDLAATLLAALGIDPATRIEAPGARPIPLIDGGTPIREILG